MCASLHKFESQNKNYTPFAGNETSEPRGLKSEESAAEAKSPNKSTGPCVEAEGGFGLISPDFYNNLYTYKICYSSFAINTAKKVYL